MTLKAWLILLCPLLACASAGSARKAELQAAEFPFKPGLWLVHVRLPRWAGVDEKSCFPAGTTLRDYANAAEAAEPGTVCEVKNQVQTAHGVAFDTACKNDKQHLTSAAHIEFELPDADQFSGTSHAVVTDTKDRASEDVVIDKSFTAKFLSPDCGSVQPLVAPGTPTAKP